MIAELPPDPLTGKRQRKYATIIGSKKEAEKALHKLIDELQYGEYIDRSDITVEAWMQEWLELYIKNTISPTTYVSYVDNMNNYIFPTLGKVQLQNLSTSQKLLALKYSAIDWDNNTLSILESRVTAGNEVIVKSPKTHSGKRDLIVPAHLMKMLHKKHVWYMQQKLLLGGDFTDSDLIICQPNGKPFHPDHFAKKFRKLLKDHGLRKIRFHDLRHTNASLMIASGIDIKVAQQRLGHSDVTTTLNIYSHVLERANREAANTIDALIFKQSSNL